MAVPDSFTALDFTGKFAMNKTLSDDTDEILRLQGVPWWKRRTIGLATVTLWVKHYKDDADVEHIDIEQTLSGGIPGTVEIRVLNWKERPGEDHVFGPYTGKSRRVNVDSEELVPFLKKDWTEDTVKHRLVQSYVQSDTPKSGTTWTANQTWGIQVIDGLRRYARQVKFTGPEGENIEAHLIYDYLGPLA
jgi:hypothetical protein